VTRRAALSAAARDACLSPSGAARMLVISN
jgi:hypothetical protein